ncbi:IS630 family transposase [Gordonia amicalis]|nr:IS630 family transposase [Gordonia amicalis]UOG20904.1 IS630 family transposase [Gordonia amicalis]UOG21375.1 IS630 family transposase [Gordonia amicalis]UOG21863.1 IS630 family transposase [Gordonia amicalis]UOG23254.1 IS630 family transposase [Gordonia amicalis]
MRAALLSVPDADRELLEKWVRSTTMKAGLVQRARVVLLAADGVAHAEIARRLSISRQTVINWRARYEASGVNGLFDKDRSGRPRTLDRNKVIAVTLKPPPGKYGVTHWSSRLLASHLKIGHGTVARVWREHGVQPWRAETFKFSTDPELVAKVTDIVGLYLEPPENAIVLCVDEKSQIQALDRTAPTLPMRIGIPERQTHDYVRHGTTTLFAALDIATGKVTGICKPRHRHQEFLMFLKHVARAYPDQQLHLVMDNYATHKKQEVRDWLDSNPRITVHFTPTSASWMNLVEVWFGIIERQAIHRGTFRSVTELTGKIRAFINGWNPRAQPFVWTKTPEEILKKANRPTTSNAGH